MKNLLLLLLIMFIGHFKSYAMPDKNVETQKEPITIQLCGGDEQENMRTLKISPVDCWYYPTTKSFLFSSFTIISNVEISIRNVTTGELFEEEYPVFAGQVCLPVTGSKGLYIIEVIINSNETFIGELYL